jgi:hypothetical protein
MDSYENRVFFEEESSFKDHLIGKMAGLTHYLEQHPEKEGFDPELQDAIQSTYRRAEALLQH